jgi:hypothetical protein
VAFIAIGEQVDCDAVICATARVAQAAACRVPACGYPGNKAFFPVLPAALHVSWQKSSRAPVRQASVGTSAPQMVALPSRQGLGRPEWKLARLRKIRGFLFGEHGDRSANV